MELGQLEAFESAARRGNVSTAPVSTTNQRLNSLRFISAPFCWIYRLRITVGVDNKSFLHTGIRPEFYFPAPSVRDITRLNTRCIWSRLYGFVTIPTKPYS